MVNARSEGNVLPTNPLRIVFEVLSGVSAACIPNDGGNRFCGSHHRCPARMGGLRSISAEPSQDLLNGDAAGLRTISSMMQLRPTLRGYASIRPARQTHLFQSATASSTQPKFASPHSENRRIRGALVAAPADVVAKRPGRPSVRE